MSLDLKQIGTTAFCSLFLHHKFILISAILLGDFQPPPPPIISVPYFPSPTHCQVHQPFATVVYPPLRPLPVLSILKNKEMFPVRTNQFRTNFFKFCIIVQQKETENPNKAKLLQATAVKIIEYKKIETRNFSLVHVVYFLNFLVLLNSFFYNLHSSFQF